MSPRQYETDLYKQIQLNVSPLGARLLRNDNGVGFRRNGTRFRYGLGTGTGDLVGFTPVVIQPRHVGLTLAVFTSIECKGTKRTKTTEEQKDWHALVLSVGGISAIVRAGWAARQVIEAAQAGNVGI